MMKSARSILRTGFAGLTLGLFFAVANAQNAPKGAADYWPFKEGSTWTLLTKIGEKSIPQIITVTKVTNTGGKTEAKLEYQANGKTVQAEIYQADAKSLVRLASGQNASDKISPPFPVILFPLTEGKKWTWKG